MRAARRLNLAAAKSSRLSDDDDEIVAGVDKLPSLGASQETRDVGDDIADGDDGSSNPFSNVAADIHRKGSSAAAALSTAGKNASKSISEMVSSYGTKAATKLATNSVNSSLR